MFIQIILILFILIKYFEFIFYSKQKKIINLQKYILHKNNFEKINFPYKQPLILSNNFEFIGNLYNKEKNIMLKLYGRERIRHVWDYFIIYNNHSTETKIDLSTIKKRLENLDSLYIEIFQTEFILYINENKYKYYPYILYN